MDSGWAVLGVGLDTYLGSVMVIVLAVFGMRLVVLFIHMDLLQRGLDGDDSVHFLLIQSFKRVFRIRRVKNFRIGSAPFSYPPLFHMLSSLIPLRTIRKKLWMPNLVIFVALGSSGLVAIALFSQDIAAPGAGLLLLVAALMTPSMMVATGPAVAYFGLSERLLGRLSTALGFLFLIMALDDPTWFLALASTSSFAVGIAGSKFARQTTIFVLPVVAALQVSLLPLFVLLSSFFLTLLCFPRHFIHSLRYQLRHLTAYVELKESSPTVKASQNRVITLNDLKQVRSGNDAVKLLRHEPFRFFRYYPEIVLVLLLTQDFTSPVISVLLASLVVFAVTSLDRFSFLGESYRYLEFATPFMLPFLLWRGELGGLTQMAVLAIAIYSSTWIIGLRLRRSYRAKDEPEDELSDLLMGFELTPEDTVLTVGMRLGPNIAARYDCRCIWWQPGNINGFLLKQLAPEYPFLKGDLRQLAAAYTVRYLVVDRRQLANYEDVGQLAYFRKINETGNFVLFAAEGLRRGPQLETA